MPGTLALPASLKSDRTLHVAAVAAGYFLAAKASLLLAIPPGYACAVWPPAGIALAAALFYGPRIWPGVWLGALLANYTVNQSIGVAGMLACGNTLEALCAAWLVRRFIGAPFEFAHPSQVFRFVAIAALGATLSATPAISVLHLAGGIPDGRLLENWYTWWQGDTTGIVVVAPMLLAWLRGDRTAMNARRTRELAAFLVLLAAALAAFPFSAVRPFLLIPLIAWAGCRLGDRVVTTSIAMITLASTWDSVNGLGPFALGSLNESLLMLQAFVSSIALMGLVLCALTHERADALLALERSCDNLEQIVQSRTEELRFYAERQRSMTHRIVEAQETEGRRVSHELHDRVGQNLSALNINLDIVLAALKHNGSTDLRDRLEDSRSLVIDTAKSIENIMTELRPPLLDEFGLAAALENHAREFTRRTGVRVQFDDTGGSAVALGPDASIALFRIAQEALNNVAKHARARQARVVLACDRRDLEIRVSDDGSGFDPQAPANARRGWGLITMRERAESLGARFEAESLPGRGTTVRVRLPASRLRSTQSSVEAA